MEEEIFELKNRINQLVLDKEDTVKSLDAKWKSKLEQERSERDFENRELEQRISDLQENIKLLKADLSSGKLIKRMD